MSQNLQYQDLTISSGDTIKIHQEITEGTKSRIQVYEGVVIAIKNAGTGKSITVRKIATGSIGVEKVFPIFSPTIKKIELKRKGNARRSKLYYLRERIGKKATKVKEKSTLNNTEERA